ncbi:MAG: hypothetical protein R2809_06270 [Flavobacteriales bacterium]
MKKELKRIIALAGIMTLMMVFGFIYRYEIASAYRSWRGIELPANPRPEGMSTIDWAELNYRDEMLELSTKYNLPYEYLMALCVLECSGDKPAGHRFEKHVKKKLEKLQSGKRDKFENIKANDIDGCNDECLENLSTSWGPFQLMGYKCIALGVNVADLRDEELAAEVGVRWIESEYGNYLSKKKYQDAFHIHNTGQRFPLNGVSKTHSPYYVSDGLRYMKIFKDREKKRQS